MQISFSFSPLLIGSEWEERERDTSSVWIGDKWSICGLFLGELTCRVRAFMGFTPIHSQSNSQRTLQIPALLFSLILILTTNKYYNHAIHSLSVLMIIFNERRKHNNWLLRAIWQQWNGEQATASHPVKCIPYLTITVIILQFYGHQLFPS
jgi:hypothetical protein